MDKKAMIRYDCAFEFEIRPLGINCYRKETFPTDQIRGGGLSLAQIFGLFVKSLKNNWSAHKFARL